MDLEMNIVPNMETELLQGLNSDVNLRRLASIQEAAQSIPLSQLESESIKTPVSEVVKNLEKETVEMFPNKEEVAETTLGTEKSEDISNREKRILGMTPPVFTLVAIATIIGGIALYQKLKPAK